MSGDHSQQLAQLADIHVAAEPGMWPPAPGWWVLGFIALLGLLMLLRAVMRKLAVRRRRRAWMAELDSIAEQFNPEASPHEYLAAVNRLFRAVALRAFPDTHCAKLEGEAWVAFISGLMPEGEAASGLAVLARGPYAPAPDFDPALLKRLAASWVEQYG
jgi:hypothetical protein